MANEENAADAARRAASFGADATRRAAETLSGLTRAAADSQAALFGDITRMMSELRFPTLLPDSGALMAAHRRNMEALSAANKLALEGAQAVARRNMEIMQQSMHEFTEHLRELTTAENPQTKAARQAELLKRAYEHAIGNLRELSDLIQKSNTEAIKLLDDRFREAMDEIRGLIEKTHDKPGPGARG